MKWFPWRFVIRRIARAHGFLDPVALLSRLHRFAQPSEVGEPVELLRAGVVFHARGLVNSRVIQHNLDWVWPHWIERQFDPRDDAFVPRAFSITHINLTHRNWTALGVPDCGELPIVDPRGLLTPFLDGWSLDAWILADDRCLFPSRSKSSQQTLEFEHGLTVTTRTREGNLALTSRASVELESGAPACLLRLKAEADVGTGAPASLVLALRPQNPEGVSFIHAIELSPERTAWLVDGRPAVIFDSPAERHPISNYRAGDVQIHLRDRKEEKAGTCEVGMATAAALFQIPRGLSREVTARIPLETPGKRESGEGASGRPWTTALEGHCALRCPDAHFQFLYDAAIRTLVLHSPGDVYPGPYTYKRFWFRDAAFIIHALLSAGFIARAERAIDRFPPRQTAFGYFRSQEGEWDSNGEALWIMRRFCELTGQPPKRDWHRSILHGAEWIARKRLSEQPDSPHAGLLPAGFSAEHLGPNDFYYWDDFWGVAGLQAAGFLARQFDASRSAGFHQAAVAFGAAIDRSLTKAARRLGRPAIPASPYRRLDAGAIGSLAAGYPLNLWTPHDERLLDTVEFLLNRCFFDGAFFQDMIHSGINAYLTLHVAQVLLRAGDARFHALAKTVADLASPTGQWPEAIHPRTGGGCMGDGQHVWAAAEWVMMIRNRFVREEGDRLILGSGIPADWLEDSAGLRFGPAPTSFGPVSLQVTHEAGKGAQLSWQGDWHDGVPRIELQLAGYRAAPAGESCVALVPENPR